MAVCQSWKPVYFVLIFVLGFFVFSTAPFSVPHVEAVNGEGEMEEKHEITTSDKSLNLPARNIRSPKSEREILATAMKYKHPLTVDVPTENKIGPHSPLAKRELEITRIERNSPVLDFLDIDRMITQEIEQHSHSGRHDDLDKTDGIKRSVQKVSPTDAVIQELVGDKDDLEGLKKQTKKQETTALTNGLNRKPRLTRLEIDIENDLRRRKRHEKIGHHHRARRGLGRWLKSIFHGKSTSTTRPQGRKNSPREEVREKSEDHGWKKPNEIKIKKMVNGERFSGKDTAIDMLLPKYLRRSSYWERKMNTKPDNTTNDDSSGEEPNYYFQYMKRQKEKEKRVKRGIFDELPFFDSLYTNDAGGSVFPRMLQTKNAMQPNIFSGNFFSTPVERFYRPVQPPQEKGPLTAISKEEMKIMHEIFSHIINERCYPVNSQVLEVLQYTMSSLIDSSNWPEMSVPNNLQVDGFLQKVVNCSSDAVNIMAWKNQRTMQMSSRFEDIEEGSPLLRTKRITDFDIQQEKQKRALQTNYVNDREPKTMPILQTQLDQLLTLMSNLVVDECRNIEPILMNSALELTRSTIKNTFPHLKVNMDIISNVEADILIKSLKKCSNFPSKNSKKVAESPMQNHLKPEYYPPPNFQRRIQPSNQNLQPQQNQMNYWDKIPANSLNLPFPTLMLPQPSPVPAPPLQQPQNFIKEQENSPVNSLSSNYNYNNGYSYGSSSGNNPPKLSYTMGPTQFQNSDTRQQIRPLRNTFVRTSSFNFPIIPTGGKKTSNNAYSYNYNYSYK